MRYMGIALHLLVGIASVHCLATSTIPAVQLNGVNGKVAMPMVGVGTGTDTNASAEQSVKTAFGVGYRHVDTAFLYGNQLGVGRALKEVGVPRDEYFVTSKIPPLNASDTAQVLDQCLHELGLEYVDLMLIHYDDPGICSSAQRKGQWLALEKWAKEGKARALGVSHYCKAQLEDILSVATVPIAVDQVQYHVGMGTAGPMANNDKSFIQSHGILYQSFSPLCGFCDPADKMESVNGSSVTEIGKAHNKSGVQISLKWLVQQGIPVIPRSGSKEHLESNADIFDFILSDTDMDRITMASKPAVAGGPISQDSGDCPAHTEVIV